MLFPLESDFAPSTSFRFRVVTRDIMLVTDLVLQLFNKLLD